jgi:hypothetical protein
MDYATARQKIAQQQLRQYKKNRGTSMDCSIHNQRPITMATRIDAKVKENHDRAMEHLTAMRKTLRNLACVK